MRSWIASILLVAVCTLTPALAQNSASPADKPSQEQINAAMDLLEASNTTATMRAVVETLLPLQAAQLRREHPNASEETIKAVLNALNGILLNHTDDMLRLYAVGYARHFTVDEMHTLADFYRSPIGQKYLRGIPPLMKEMTPIVVSYLSEVLSREIEGVVEKMRAQGVKI